MKFNHVDENGIVAIRREEPVEYIFDVIVKKALTSEARIVIQYQDGSSTVINPTEE